MAKVKARFRRPVPEEQEVLDHVRVELVRADQQARFNRLLVEEHYLHSDRLVGERLCYVARYRGQWLALAAWSAPALHLQARDRFIGWTEEQRRQRLGLVVNNSRLVVRPACHYPNLVSRFMKLMLARLSEDWQGVWKHPVVLAETFVDPALYRGTAYKVSGWSRLGATRGWKRSAEDFYQKHDQPKEVWVRELVKRACPRLRAVELPAAWAAVAAQVAPRCTAKADQIGSLMARLRREVPEFRRRQALAYPVAGMVALIAMALFSGVAKGYEDLADYAATLSQGQLRALGFRNDPHTRRVRCPKKSCFERVLAEVDAGVIERVLLRWQDQVLGLTQDRLVILDGKEHRHADVETVSAVDGTGRWLGTVPVATGSNEIPAARQQLAKLDVMGKIVLADAAHTQVQTVQQVLYEGGGDYLLTVKANQKGLVETLEKLLTPQRFSPSADTADACLHPRAQPEPAGDPGAGLPGGNAGAGGLSRSPDHRPAQTAGAA